MTTATEIPHTWDGRSMWRHKSPLADGLYRIRIPAHTSEQDLVERVQDTGTWAALMRMVQLIETPK